MKRLALLAASVAALMLFTACNDTDENLYYSEDITVTYKYANRPDSTFHFTQEFTKVENVIIYNPSSSVNRVDPYIDFRYGYTCPIIHDTIYYPEHLNVATSNFVPKKAKIEYAGKKSDDFSFQYSPGTRGTTVVSAKHTCHRIDKLSD